MTTFLPNITLTQDILRSLLRYDPATGEFFWLTAQSNSVKVGQKAGHLSKEGYIRITIARRRFLAHILAWLYMTGEYVPRGLDHRDTVRHNNAWDNLRRATRSQNRMNSNIRSDNKSGVKGVHIRPGCKPYAQITLPGCRAKYLGSFDTVEEAGARYAEEAEKNFGEFVRLS